MTTQRTRWSKQRLIITARAWLIRTPAAFIGHRNDDDIQKQTTPAGQQGRASSSFARWLRLIGDQLQGWSPRTMPGSLAGLYVLPLGCASSCSSVTGAAYYGLRACSRVLASGGRSQGAIVSVQALLTLVVLHRILQRFGWAKWQRAAPWPTVWAASMLARARVGVSRSGRCSHRGGIYNP